MVLYKTTKEGAVPMTKEEEAEILAERLADRNRPPAIKVKTVEETLQDIETRLRVLENKK